MVSTIPPWLLLLGLVLAVAGMSVAVQAYIRRRFPALTGDAHNDVTKFVFGVVSFVFAFFLGFAIMIGAELNAAIQEEWPAPEPHLARWRARWRTRRETPAEEREDAGALVSPS